MELRLKREPSTALSTPGKLYIDGLQFCHTLEDPVRPVKIAGVTAIPAGRYRIGLAISPKRQILVPWILNVPNYETVQIHFGNTARDTEGCVLVGLLRGTDCIFRSRDAFKALMAQLQKGMNGNEVWIEIQDYVAPAVA
jgi:hypothetical protein